MIWIIVAIAVVVVVVAGLLLARRQQSSRQLKAGFGPEYDRVVAQQGEQGAAEQELRERRERHDEFELRSLEPAVRKRYDQRWQATQRRFVDQPAAAVGEADALVREVMHDRGYPVDNDFEQRAADISVDHPVVVENYRAGHAISVRAERGQATTEQLRQSMVHYRALFSDLLAPNRSANSDDGGRSRQASPKTTRSV